MRKLPIPKASLEDRIARRAAELIEQAEGLPEGSKERQRLERRAQAITEGAFTRTALTTR